MKMLCLVRILSLHFGVEEWGYSTEIDYYARVGSVIPTISCQREAATVDIGSATWRVGDVVAVECQDLDPYDITECCMMCADEECRKYVATDSRWPPPTVPGEDDCNSPNYKSPYESRKAVR